MKVTEKGQVNNSNICERMEVSKEIEKGKYPRQVYEVKRGMELYRLSGEIRRLQDTAQTALDASKALQVELGAIVKSLLFKSEGGVVIILVSGAKKLNFKLYESIFSESLEKCSAEEVKSWTGFSIGGVSPVLGKDFQERCHRRLLDSNLRRYEKLYASAGHSHHVFAVDYVELRDILKYQEVEGLTD